MKTVHIVYGPPLAGKSTFVRENMGPDDLVFDMDAVQNALCYGADHAGKPHTLGAAIALRNAFIYGTKSSVTNGTGSPSPVSKFRLSTNWPPIIKLTPKR